MACWIDCAVCLFPYEIDFRQAIDIGVLQCAVGAERFDDVLSGLSADTVDTVECLGDTEVAGSPREPAIRNVLLRKT